MPEDDQCFSGFGGEGGVFGDGCCGGSGMSELVLRKEIEP